MIGDLLKALGQMGDPRFRGTLLRGIGLTVLLLLAVYAGFLWLVNWLLPDTMALPLIGEVAWVDDIASGASVLLLLVASVFLMVPVASAFTGFFLDDVTDAVEARHYPRLTPAPRLGLLASLGEASRFFAVIVVGNLLALALYLAFPPIAPFVFVGLNGYLLGREYFQLIASRRLGREGARRMRRRYGLRIWLAGILMALPLTVPVVNLLIPVLGAATFTHLYHRLAATSG
ncbi:EI24 domain-containing protein [Roseitranquillus sediminis]|uniref:EI24 domain-containing protein n=1 Tax=Roseitranquillus sediminis TaxID=2809051 RepID=UPI001D0C8359|nr:EI24 domain-containing protein [Roseitranquillus sediminis]MBM9594959.1 EI24 domain-containing protein [Roseitranquillus sediminis]